MLHDIEIHLSTEYELTPSHCKIIINDEIIFNDFVNKNLILKYQKKLDREIKIEIHKSGKTIDIVKKKLKQKILLEKLIVNNIAADIQNFSKFHAENNPYVDDHVLETTHLELNGRYIFHIPIFSLEGKSVLKKNPGVTRDPVEDCDIVVFGGYETYGIGLNHNETWPIILKNKTNLNIKNYGINYGKNFSTPQEILSSALEYANNYQCKILICVFTQFKCRQLFDLESNSYKNFQRYDARYPDKNFEQNKESLEQIGIMDKLGDEQLIMSQIPEFIEIFKKILKRCEKIYFIVSKEENRKIFSKNIFLKNMLIPAIKPADLHKRESELEKNKNNTLNQLHQNILANAVLQHLILNKELKERANLMPTAKVPQKT